MIDPICKPCPEPEQVILVDQLPDVLCPCPVPEEKPSLLEKVTYQDIITDTYLDSLRKILRTFNCETEPKKVTYRPPLINGYPPSGLWNVPYEFSFKVSEGEAPFTFQVKDGDLPLGISLNPATGKLTGIPGETGRFNFTILVRDNRGRSNSMFTVLEINA